MRSRNALSLTWQWLCCSRMILHHDVNAIMERSCHVHKHHLTALLCLLCFPIVLGQALHGVNLGENVTLDFHHELESANSDYSCNAYHDGSPDPFYKQNKINSPGLKPGQAGRVDVKEDRSQRNVNITISIYDVQPIDEGLYNVDIIELNDGVGSSHAYQTYFNVTYPPGSADCHIENPPRPTGDWLLVRCNATAGNDNTGSLMCYQNSKQLPYLEPVEHIDDYMTGLFWIDPTLEVRCCSAYNASDVDVESCNDFVQPSSDGSTSTDKPDLIANAWSSASPSITEDDMDQHDGKGRELSVASVILGTSLGVFVLVILAIVLAVFMYCKQKRNNKESCSSRGGQTVAEQQPLDADLNDQELTQISNGSVI